MQVIDPLRNNQERVENEVLNMSIKFTMHPPINRNCQYIYNCFLKSASLNVSSTTNNSYRYNHQPTLMKLFNSFTICLFVLRNKSCSCIIATCIYFEWFQSLSLLVLFSRKDYVTKQLVLRKLMSGFDSVNTFKALIYNKELDVS